MALAATRQEQETHRNLPTINYQSEQYKQNKNSKTKKRHDIRRHHLKKRREALQASLLHANVNRYLLADKYDY